MPETRTQLSRDLITSTALDLVACEGLEALSMRRLAQELDVWPMSVYRHFRDKEDLLDAVAAAAVESIDLPASGGDWRDRLAVLAEELRALLARQPVELRRRTLVSPGILRIADEALRALRGGGLDEAGAAVAWRAVLAYVVGSIELEAAAGTSRELQATLLAVPENELPDLAACASEVARALGRGVEGFDEGLGRVLDGIPAERR